MTRRIYGVVALALCMCTGCSQKETDMSAMKPPERSMELDKLEPWVGRWTNNGEMTMGDKKVKFTGASNVAWECEKRVLVERMEGEMEGMGKMVGMAVYAWDADAKKFKTFWFSSMGECSGGQMCYSEKDKCWCMSGKGKNPMTGETTHFEGHIKFPDNSTMEWSWKEKDAWGLKTTAEGSGTAKRS